MHASHDSHALLAHAGWVRALARALVRDAAEADDLAQDALAVALERGPHDPGAWKGWARAVLRNLLAQRRRASERRARRERAAARPEARPSALDDADRLATHRRVVAAVEALDEPFRTAVLLRYFDGLAPREIAARLGVPVKTIHSRLERAHARLREELRARHGDEERSLRALVLLCGRRAPRALRPWHVAVPVGALALAGIAVARWAPVWSGRGSRAETRVAVANAPGADAELADPATPPALRRDAHEDLPARGNVGGRVLDQAGDPIAGAEIELHARAAAGMDLRAGAFGAHDELVARATTDRDGSWRAEVPTRVALELEARAQGRALARADGVVAGETVETRMEAAAALALVCRDARGVPCTGARVDVHAAGVEEPFVTGRTDIDGAWRTSALAPGAWRVIVRPAGSASEVLLDFGARAGETLEREVVVPDGLAFDGTVRAAEDGRAVAGAEISVAPDGHVCTRSDAQGRFRVRGLSAERGAWDVRVAATGFASASRRVPVPAGESPALAFELARGWTLSGRVLAPAGGPLAGAWVVAWTSRTSAQERAWDQRETRSAADGSFELSDLRADMDYAVLVRAPGRGTEIVVAPRQAAGTVHTLEPVTVRPGASIAGTLRRADGSAIPGAEVRVGRLDRLDTLLHEEDLPGTKTTVVIGVGSSAQDGVLDLSALVSVLTRVRADGTYRVTDLAPGRYNVKTFAPAAGRIASMAVELRPGTELAGIDLVAPPGDVIAGRVLDPDLRPLAGGWVLLFEEGARLEKRSMAVDEEGRFRFEGLEPGTYTVTALDQTRRTDRPPHARGVAGGLAVGATEVEIVLGRNARVVGRVVDGTGRALGGALISMIDAAGHGAQVRSAPDGGFELLVPEGSVFALEASWSEPSGDARALTVRLEDVQAGSGELVLRLE